MNVIREDLLRPLTKAILESAVKVHRELGPGLLEGTYRTCLLHQLEHDGFRARSEVPLPICYQGLKKEFAYRADIIVDDKVLVELKAVETILPVHEAQVLTYLRHSGLRVGLLMNFNVRQLLQGVRRLVR